MPSEASGGNVIDQRSIVAGRIIPTERYADQPYVVVTDDDAWLCALTTGGGTEGEPGQHVVTYRSSDCGLTWQGPINVEPADGPEASYAVLLKVPSGRIYCFYNHNTDNLREVIADNPPFPNGKCKRVDSLGHFVFKYSDDHGRTWSAKRYSIPVRKIAIDRENVYAGEICFFWNVGKPFCHAQTAYVPLHKVGGFGDGFFTRSEGVLLASSNIMSEANPEAVVWETLPDGDAGLRTPHGGGPIAEEHSTVVLSDGTFYCVYRSVDGHPVYSRSCDQGHTWDEPQYLAYADGRLVKHPRAANFVWRCLNGKYLYWFHNHGGVFIRDKESGINPYDDRNPVWLCGGVEVDTERGKTIAWSQPEIILYDDDPFIRISYPDLIEYRGCIYITETQKNIARSHLLDGQLLDNLWLQAAGECSLVAKPVLDVTLSDQHAQLSVPMPKLPVFITRDHARADYGTSFLRTGFSVELWINFTQFDGDHIILDNRSAAGKGFFVQVHKNKTLSLCLNDGRTCCLWSCDPGCLMADTLHHVVITVDSGPHVISFVIDDKLNDGGVYRQFGWGRLSLHLRDVNGSDTLSIIASDLYKIEKLRIYDQPLTTSAAITLYNLTS